MRLPSTLLRVLGMVVFTALIAGAIVLGLLALLPFGRRRRVLFTNAMGTVLGRGVVGLAGSRVTVYGREHARAGRPVLYANNHTSTLDAFLTIWLTPRGTVGLAKKEIVYYPFYGLAWWLSGHPLIDRSNPDRARASMRELGELVRKWGFAVCLLPEGTRSRDGRLLPFKKGIVHLAIQTRLPIVPMVTIGAAGAWDKGSAVLRRREIEVRFLPPVDTTGWSLDAIDHHLEELRMRFVRALPDGMLTPEDRGRRDRDARGPSLAAAPGAPERPRVR
jgi:1-acyl-sn-glycerol-3-phosphate acyltransferase